ncbi:MAG: TraB/GumN family protein [Sphingopyxis sp.]|nr:TraB/GumN family protein [Sphingopyxis sp.]
MIRDDDTMLFVTGTVHLLPSDIDWRSPAINRAMSAADELVTELSPAELGRIGDIAPTYAKAVSATPAGDRFAPDLRDDFADFAGDQNIAADQMAAIDDWAIALTLAQASARSAGLSADYGMDRALTATFARAGKRQSGLELATDQLGAFDAIPASEQRLMLNRLMRDIADGRADDRLHEMIAAWSAGDLDALAAIIARDANLAPQANRIMLTDRNRKWSDWIIKRLERPGTTLVAVGAGHLAGPDSLIAILAARGIAAQRLN